MIGLGPWYSRGAMVLFLIGIDRISPLLAWLLIGASLIAALTSLAVGSTVITGASFPPLLLQSLMISSLGRMLAPCIGGLRSSPCSIPSLCMVPISSSRVYRRLFIRAKRMRASSRR